MGNPDIIGGDVTPLVGVWIEINKTYSLIRKSTVTPLVGVWIEIHATCKDAQVKGVTPLVGVWIEILYLTVPEAS